MDNQITLEEALALVDFEFYLEGWRVKHVKGSIYGNVNGDVYGDVRGNVRGDIWRNVGGNVGGTISGRQWKLIETPKEKLKRLVKEGAGKGELLAVIDQLENSNG